MYNGGGDDLVGAVGDGLEDTLDFLFAADGPFRLPAGSEELFGTFGRSQQREASPLAPPRPMARTESSVSSVASSGSKGKAKKSGAATVTTAQQQPQQQQGNAGGKKKRPASGSGEGGGGGGSKKKAKGVVPSGNGEGPPLPPSDASFFADSLMLSYHSVTSMDSTGAAATATATASVGSSKPKGSAKGKGKKGAGSKGGTAAAATQAPPLIPAAAAPPPPPVLHPDSSLSGPPVFFPYAPLPANLTPQELRHPSFLLTLRHVAANPSIALASLPGPQRELLVMDLRRALDLVRAQKAFVDQQLALLDAWRARVTWVEQSHLPQHPPQQQQQQQQQQRGCGGINGNASDNMLFGDDKMLLGLLEGDGEGEGDEAAMWDALGGIFMDEGEIEVYAGPHPRAPSRPSQQQQGGLTPAFPPPSGSAGAADGAAGGTVATTTVLPPLAPPFNAAVVPQLPQLPAPPPLQGVIRPPPPPGCRERRVRVRLKSETLPPIKKKERGLYATWYEPDPTLQQQQLPALAVLPPVLPPGSQQPPLVLPPPSLLPAGGQAQGERGEKGPSSPIRPLEPLAEKGNALGASSLAVGRGDVGALEGPSFLQQLLSQGADAGKGSKGKGKDKKAKSKKKDGAAAAARSITGPLSIPPPTTAGAAQVDTVDPSAAPVPEMPFYDRLDAYADFDSSARNLWLYVDEGGFLCPALQLLLGPNGGATGLSNGSASSSSAAAASAASAAATLASVKRAMEDALPFERDAGTATLAEPHHHHHHYPPRLQPHGSEPSLLLRELCAADEEDGQGFEGILDLVLLQQRRRVKKEEGEGVGEEGGLLSEEERKGLEWAEVGYDKELHRAPLLRRLLSAFVHPPRLPPVDKEEEGPAAAIGGPLSRKRRREGEEEGGEEEEKGEAEPPLRTSGSTKGGGGKSSSGGHEKDKEKGAKGGGGGAQHAHFARPVASPIPSSSAVDGEAIGPLQVPQRELSGGNGSSGLPKQGRGLLADPSPRTPRGHTLEAMVRSRLDDLAAEELEALGVWEPLDRDRARRHFIRTLSSAPHEPGTSGGPHPAQLEAELGVYIRQDERALHRAQRANNLMIAALRRQVMATAAAEVAARAEQSFVSEDDVLERYHRMLRRKQQQSLQSSSSKEKEKGKAKEAKPAQEGEAAVAEGEGEAGVVVEEDSQPPPPKIPPLVITLPAVSKMKREKKAMAAAAAAGGANGKGNKPPLGSSQSKKKKKATEAKEKEKAAAATAPVAASAVQGQEAQDDAAAAVAAAIVAAGGMPFTTGNGSGNGDNNATLFPPGLIIDDVGTTASTAANAATVATAAAAGIVVPSDPAMVLGMERMPPPGSDDIMANLVASPTLSPDGDGSSDPFAVFGFDQAGWE